MSVIVALVVGIILALLILLPWLRVRYMESEMVTDGTDGVKADEEEIEYRDEDEAAVAEAFKERLLDADDGVHINDAVEMGAEMGLSKRRSRVLVDEWAAAGAIPDFEVNEPGPGRPKRYVGGKAPPT